MEKPHYFRFGSSTAPGGALYCVKDAEGEIQVYKEYIKSNLEVSGIQVTPEIEQVIVEYLRCQQQIAEQQLYSEGIPEKFQDLFDFTKKKKAVAYCKTIRISEDELALLVHNCSQIGFKHRSKFKEFVPKERLLSDSDISDLKQGKPRNFISKVRSIFQERKKYHVQLFEKGTEWHCFYYTYRDMQSGQWKLGSHLHYVSHLWPEYRKRQVWESFDKRDVSIRGIHIKLEPFVYDSEANNQPFSSFIIELMKIIKEAHSNLG